MFVLVAHIAAVIYSSLSNLDYLLIFRFVVIHGLCKLFNYFFYYFYKCAIFTIYRCRSINGENIQSTHKKTDEED